MQVLLALGLEGREESPSRWERSRKRVCAPYQDYM